MQQGSGTNGSGTLATTAALTDEQILGMDSGDSAVAQAAARDDDAGAATFLSDVPRSMGGADRGTENASGARQVESDTAAPRATAEPSQANERNAPVAPEEPAWLKTLEAQPEAAAEARQWREAARDVAAIDSAYFSADAAARTGLASRLYDSDPGAFRDMLAESARVLASRDPQALAQLAQQLGAPEPPARAAGTKSVASVARDAQPAGAPENATRPEGTFPADAYRAFESGTNAEVARRMGDAIDRALRGTLPEGVSEGARRRIGDDISREIQASLANDRELTRQVGDVLRGWRFDSASQQRVIALLSGRARTVLPEVARRVVGEWTSSVLASDRARVARVDAATARRDVTGGRLPEPIAAGTLHPRDINYGSTSDEQILSM
jgi:hypothetical protein